MYQKKQYDYEIKFYKALERLDNSIERLVIVMKDLGLKMKRWDIIRLLNVMKFNCVKEENSYYLTFEKYIEKILIMSENEIRKYFLMFVPDDIKEIDFSNEDRKLKEIKKDLQVLGFTDKQCQLVCFRELTIEERYELELARRNKEIIGLKNKVKTLEKRNVKVVYQDSLFGGN